MTPQIIGVDSSVLSHSFHFTVTLHSCIYFLIIKSFSNFSSELCDSKSTPERNSQEARPRLRQARPDRQRDWSKGQVKRTACDSDQGSDWSGGQRVSARAPPRHGGAGDDQPVQCNVRPSLLFKNWGCPAELLTNQTVLDPKVHCHTSRAAQVGIEPTSPPTKVVALPTTPQIPL